MDWAVFQACLEDRLPGSPVVKDKEAIDKCIEELTSAIQAATAASTSSIYPVPIPDPLYPLVSGRNTPEELV
jgi:hypothetical protein